MQGQQKNLCNVFKQSMYKNVFKIISKIRIIAQIYFCGKIICKQINNMKKELIQEFIQYIDIQMISQQQLQQTYQVQESHYNTISQEIIHYPKQQRKCTNTLCTSLLMITILLFFSIGIFYIVQYTYLQYAKVNEYTEDSVLYDEKDIDVLEHWQIIAIGVSISIAISFIYILALNKLPKQIIFVGIILNMCIIGGLCVFGYFIDNLGLMLSMGILFVLYVIFICFIKQKIGVGITMVKICGRFINEKPIIFLLPIIKFFLTGGVTIFFIFTVSSTYFIISHKSNNNMSTTLQITLISLQLTIYIILIFLFYYMMCYTIGYICSNWYYNIKDKRATLLKCYKNMFIQIGSLMYGAMIIGLVIIAKIVLQIKRKSQKKQNCVINCCIAMVLCIFSRIQTFMQVLNHYTIIMISITGEDYINGAKTTIGLIYKQIDLMVITNLISNFLIVWGLILTVGIPTFTTFLLIAYKQAASPAQQHITIGIVGICSVLISIIILVTIIQSISCIFIVYNIDKDMVQRKLIKNKRLQEETYYQIDRCSTNPYGNDNFDTMVQFGNYNYVKLQK